MVNSDKPTTGSPKTGVQNTTGARPARTARTARTAEPYQAGGNAERPTVRNKRATLKDVARAVGVHVSTVSRALNPATRHLITGEIAARVLKASQQLDYRPNPAAYSLRTNRSHTIGIVVPDITNSIFPPMIRGIEDILAPHGYAALVVNTDLNREREAAAISTLSARGVDGVIVASAERQDAALSALAEQGIPVVTINRRTDDASVSSVISDEIEGIQLMLAHLVDLGHRRIATIAGNQNLSTAQRRYDAFLRNAVALGVQIGPDQVAFAEAFNEAEGRRAMDGLLSKGCDATAVLCANDRLAIGAITALRARGLSCPRDMSVTGFNDMAMVDCIDPPLTTVRIPHYDIGQAAAEFLLQRMNAPQSAQAQHQGLPQHQILPVELVLRASTAAPRQNRLPKLDDTNKTAAVPHVRIVR